MENAKMSIGVGDRFPGVKVQSLEGPVDLAQLWSHGPLVIAFHRMWCPFCRQAAIQLNDAAPELERLGGAAVIVYREDIEKVADACADRRTEALCASDEHHSLEDAVGLDRFNPLRYVAFSPRRILAARRAGATVGGMGSNVLQGRGTYVVDRGGSAVYAHQARTAADIAPIDDVIAAVRFAA
jgi:peroxiredoxin